MFFIRLPTYPEHGVMFRILKIKNHDFENLKID